jgi:hypothetical protein
MVRNATRVVLVAGLVGIGWGIGHAQTAAQRDTSLAKPAPPELSVNSDFELQVFTENGATEVVCVRGCKLTWAPTGKAPDGEIYLMDPNVKVKGVVTADGCVGWGGSKNCHILGWTKWPPK